MKKSEYNHRGGIRERLYSSQQCMLDRDRQYFKSYLVLNLTTVEMSMNLKNSLDFFLCLLNVFYLEIFIYVCVQFEICHMNLHEK